MEKQEAVAFFNLVPFEYADKGDWTRDDEKAYGAFIDGQKMDRKLLLAMKDNPPPIYLGWNGGQIKGTVMVPIGFPKSELGRRFQQYILESEKIMSQGSWVEAAFDREPEALSQVLLEDSRLMFGTTISLFALLFYGLLLVASAAYGYSSNWEEVPSVVHQVISGED